MSVSLARKHISLLLLSLALAACGGGGGGGADNVVSPEPSPGPNQGSNPTPTPSPNPPAVGSAPAQYTVSGAISVLSTGAIDSDTNDPIQSYVSNDTFNLAQTLPNPVLLTGHLNIKDQGFEGPNRRFGDLRDTYRVRLNAGQTIEIDFAADPSKFDIDLLLFNSQQALVGESIGTNRYECIRVTQAGDYFIGVDVFTDTSINDSVYQLRISAPGGGSSACVQANAVSSSIVPNEIVAEPKEQALAAFGKSGVTSGDSALLSLSLKVGEPQAQRPALYSPPADASERLNRMSAVQKSMRSQLSSVSVAPSEVGYQRRSDRGLDAVSVDILDTIVYAKLMQRSGQFAYAEPNIRFQSLQATQAVGALPSNDREYSRQRWHYEMISLPLAMQTLASLSPQPTRRPIVAVVDSGIVPDHPDLVNNIIGGYDFIRDATNAGDGNGIDSNPDESAPASRNPRFHGSHVAGTVAAQGFNELGGLGVAPMARIMPLRALGITGTGTLYDIIQAIRFAARLENDSGTLPPERADVINLSLGGDSSCPSSYQQVFNQARALGTIIVAASGNESSANSLTPVGTPANCSGVIAVGALDARRTRAVYSNGGPELAVVAPGGDVRVSTTGNGQPDGVFSTVAQFTTNAVRQPTYANLMGTSMATPHMAGVMALMRWVNPNITPAAIDTLIRNGSITDEVGTLGRDNQYGYGLINAKRAVDAAINSLNNGGGNPNPPTGRVEASPSAFDLGSIRSEAELILQRVGSTNETVTSVAVSSNIISIAPRAGAVDSARLGTYLITPNRSNIPLGQSAFANVVISTSSGRTINVSVSVARVEGGSASGNLGVIYVLVLDAENESPGFVSVAQTSVSQPVNGVYNYSVNVAPAGAGRAPNRIFISAGSDLDNDGKICNRGEACGAYLLLNNEITPISPTSQNVTGIDFSVAPFGGVNANSLGLGATPPKDFGLRSAPGAPGAKSSAIASQISGFSRTTQAK
jgi:serine protease